jgi:hypothetical protein
LRSLDDRDSVRREAWPGVELDIAMFSELAANQLR